MKSFLLLLLSSLAVASPDDFADLQRIDFRTTVTLRWASAESPMGRAVYPESRCLLRRPVAEAVARAQAALVIQGYRVILYDCYRPLSLDKVLRDKLKETAGPASHCTGGTVAIGLLDGKTGVVIDMPTPYASSSTDDSWTPARRKRAKKNAARLRAAMEKEGFKSFGNEWWRFEWSQAAFPAEDFPFAAIPARR